MKGLIIVNAYGRPNESVRQAEKLKSEFDKLGVTTEIFFDGFLKTYIYNNISQTEFRGYDFAIYLDKNKYLSAVLEQAGIKLFNNHSAIRVCDDKGETYIALANKGINLPKTVFGALSYSNDDVISDKYIEGIENQFTYPIIVKESYGSMGKGVYLVNNRCELTDVMNKLKLKPHLFQEYLGYKKGTDVRVIVIGGKVKASMRRSNQFDFRSNIALGGKGEKIDLPLSFIKTAENVAKILDLDYCGVDLLYGEDGSPYVCEVNSNAFFEEIEKVNNINIAKIYAEYVLNKVQNLK